MPNQNIDLPNGRGQVLSLVRGDADAVNPWALILTSSQSYGPEVAETSLDDHSIRRLRHWLLTGEELTVLDPVDPLPNVWTSPQPGSSDTSAPCVPDGDAATWSTHLLYDNGLLAADESEALSALASVGEPAAAPGVLGLLIPWKVVVVRSSVVPVAVEGAPGRHTLPPRRSAHQGDVLEFNLAAVSSPLHALEIWTAAKGSARALSAGT